MKILVPSISVLLIWVLSGCSSISSASPTPSGSPTWSPLVQGDQYLASKDYENAAVAYRQALDEMESSERPLHEQDKVRQHCTLALVEAGGFSASQRLWKEMAQKEPASKKEANRMQARAERMMTAQGRELLAQARVDLKDGHRSKALATAQAAQQLFDRTKALEREQAEALVKEIKGPKK